MPPTEFVPRTSPWRLRPAERRTLLLFGDSVAVILAWLTAIYFWWAEGRWVLALPSDRETTQAQK